jgi:hypothetical protein
VLVALCRIARASVRLSREVRRCASLMTRTFLALLDRCRDELGVTRRLIVLSSDDFPAPALMGVLRPRLLLPRHVLESFDSSELRLILLHELAHLKRLDVLVNWPSRCCTRRMVNPALWLAFAGSAPTASWRPTSWCCRARPAPSAARTPDHPETAPVVDRRDDRRPQPIGRRARSASSRKRTHCEGESP